MEWPVLGRKRSLPAQEKPAKKPKKLGHWSFKLAMVFGKFQLPEEVEARVEAFVTPPQFKAFREKYGSQVAQYCGPGFVSGWHPRIASTTRSRYIWDAFWRSQESGTLSMKQVEPLKGKMILIVYRNKQGNTTRMNPKRVTNAGPYSMTVDEGPDAARHGFTLSYAGVQSITLYVDMRL